MLPHNESKFCRHLWFQPSSHLSTSTLCSVPAGIMTRECFRSSAISVVSSFTRSRQLGFGLPRFRFPSTVICNIFLVASSLSRLCTCPNHLNLFSLRNSANVCLFPNVYISHRSTMRLHQILSESDVVPICLVVIRQRVISPGLRVTMLLFPFQIMALVNLWWHIFQHTSNNMRSAYDTVLVRITHLQKRERSGGVY